MRLPSMRTSLSLAAGGLFAAPALGAGLDVSIQIPQLDVAEYHRPYVAVWVEREDRSVAANLAVWYQLKRGGGMAGSAPPAGEAKPAPGAAPMQSAGEGGTKWLPDLRQWWRRTGRELSVPIDGVTGATRAVGEHQLSFTEGKAPLAALPAGKYKLMVEAAREEGGRELIDIPFEWPAQSPQKLDAQGKTELGAVKLALKP